MTKGRELWTSPEDEVWAAFVKYQREFISQEQSVEHFFEIYPQLVRGDPTEKHADDLKRIIALHDFAIGPKDSVAMRTWKLSSSLLDIHRFFAEDTKSRVWVYHSESGIWKDDGEKVIRAFVKSALGDDWSPHIANATVTSIRDSSYHNGVVLGGCTERIVLQNGTLNIDTGEFVEAFSPDEYHITALPVRYDPDAKCPTIEGFYVMVLDSQKDIDAVLEWFGYCLLKSLPIHTFVILTGSGRNGKTTLLNLLKTFIGPENVTAITLQQLEEDRFMSASLRGKLANIAGDIPDHPLEHTGKLKMLTGNDSTQAQHKCQDDFTFANYAKLIFSCNIVPATYDDTDAWWSRVRVIEFPNQFLKNDPKTDPHILDKLTTPEELSGLLNLALAALKRLLKSGHLTGEKTLEESRSDWLFRSDSIAYFIDAFLYHSPEAEEITKGRLYDLYLEVCHKLKLNPRSDNTFAKGLKRRVGWISEEQPRSGEGRVRVWRGAGIKYTEIDKLPKIEAGTGGTGGTASLLFPSNLEVQLQGIREHPVPPVPPVPSQEIKKKQSNGGEK